jgi:hypothetical protein
MADESGAFFALGAVLILQKGRGYDIMSLQEFHLK